MSDRQTGATTEQIEEAALRADQTWRFGEGMPHILGYEVREAAPFLVPPSHRIVAADDLRAVLAWIGDDERYADPDESAAIKRLRGVLGE